MKEYPGCYIKIERNYGKKDVPVHMAKTAQKEKFVKKSEKKCKNSKYIKKILIV